jgi:multidrug transporter EmrE-like cation transporter
MPVLKHTHEPLQLEAKVKTNPKIVTYTIWDSIGLQGIWCASTRLVKGSEKTVGRLGLFKHSFESHFLAVL